jgi:hypothetical protein
MAIPRSQVDYSIVRHACWMAFLNHDPQDVWIAFLMNFGAYFDDSGHPDDSFCVTVAGFVATEEQWLLFEKEWREAISAPPYNLSAFHMTHFEADRRLSREEKDKLLNKLVTIIRYRSRFHISHSVPMDEYRNINQEFAFEESVGPPYALAGRTIAKSLNHWRSKYGGEDCKLLVAFEDGTKHKGDFMHRMEADHLPCPMFLKKSEAVPLQAADLAGWEVQYALREMRLRPHYQWLLDHLPFEAGVYNRGNLEAMCHHELFTVPPRDEVENKIIAYHTTPKRQRKRTIF